MLQILKLIYDQNLSRKKTFISAVFDRNVANHMYKTVYEIGNVICMISTNRSG